MLPSKSLRARSVASSDSEENDLGMRKRRSDEGVRRDISRAETAKFQSLRVFVFTSGRLRRVRNLQFSDSTSEMSEHMFRVRKTNMVCASEEGEHRKCSERQNPVEQCERSSKDLTAGIHGGTWVAPMMMGHGHGLPEYRSMCRYMPDAH